jgi:large subunit ribosomal protein L19
MAEEKKDAKATEAKATEKTTKNDKEVKIPELKPGMTVKIFQKIKEMNTKGEFKERIQFFEGMIIAKKHGKEIGGTITVSKISNGVGVEKIFPLNLPTIEKIEILKVADVRRSKLFFLKRGYKKRLKETIVKK